MVNKRQDLKLFLVAEFLVALIAIIVFGAIASRFLAASIAGVGFVLLDVLIVWKTWRWPHRYQSPFFWAGHIHLWIFALPMLTNRLLRPEGDISRADILGVPVSAIHKGSEVFYLTLIILTIWHLFSTRESTESASHDIE